MRYSDAVADIFEVYPSAGVTGIFQAKGHSILLIEAGNVFREAPDTSNLIIINIFF